MAEPVNSEQLVYWLALWYAPGVGVSSFLKITQQFPQLKDLFIQDRATLKQQGLPDPVIDYLQNPNWSSVEKDQRWAEQSQHALLTLLDDRYPKLLREISDPPPVLYVQGDWRLLDASQLAMVGSRKPTVAGEEIAYSLAKQVAEKNLIITSGLARGVDAASHRGALAAKRPTIAVLGTGVDVIYPSSHKKLAEQIQEDGVLLSELPLGTLPRPENFPRRNRIISGLSLGVLVVEAAKRSGSLITARMALEQGREVFAVPGSIFNPLARGCHQLLRQGAKLVEGIEDILEELPTSSLMEAKATGSRAISPVTELDAGYQNLYQCIDYEVTALDKMVYRSGLAAATVSSMLTILELQGYIVAVPGGYVRRAQ